jgi:hypothetical protein
MKKRPYPTAFNNTGTPAQRPGTLPALHPATRTAFTLIELLVSMSVLTLMIVFVAQLVNSATTVTTGSRKHMDADAQARLVFDRMAVDIEKMVKRKDADYIFSNQTGTGSSVSNDSMFFYSESAAYWDGNSTDFTNRSSTSLLGYRINAAYQLERLGKLLSWDGAAPSPTPGPSPGSMVTLSYPVASASPAATPTPYPNSTLAGNWTGTLISTGTPPYSSGSDSDYHVIGDQVFRLSFCFLLKSYVDSAGVQYPGFYSVNPYNKLVPGHGSLASVQGTGLQDVAAVVVAIAVLDNTSRTIIPTTPVQLNGVSTNVPDLSKLVAAFPDPTASDLKTPTIATATPPTPTLMAQKWLSVLNQSNFASSTNLPQTSASQVRIYQRTFYLNNN